MSAISKGTDHDMQYVICTIYIITLFVRFTKYVLFQLTILNCIFANSSSFNIEKVADIVNMQIHVL